MVPILLSVPRGFNKVHAIAPDADPSAPCVRDILKGLPGVEAAPTAAAAVGATMLCLAGDSIDVFKVQQDRAFNAPSAGWPCIGPEGYIVCRRILGPHGVPHRPVRAAVAPPNIRANNNTTPMTLKNALTHPTDPHFYVAVLNSFIIEVAHSVAGGVSTVSRSFLSGIIIPGFAADGDTAAAAGDRTAAQIFDDICATVVAPPPTTIQRRAHLTSATLALPPKSHLLADVIAAGARKCAGLVPDRCSRGVALAHFAWDARSGWGEDTWTAFRTSEVVLNHLVARWYELTDDEFDAFSERLGHAAPPQNTSTKRLHGATNRTSSSSKRHKDS
jgi:hypothetical protein